LNINLFKLPLIFFVMSDNYTIIHNGTESAQNIVNFVRERKLPYVLLFTDDKNEPATIFTPDKYKETPWDERNFHDLAARIKELGF